MEQATQVMQKSCKNPCSVPGLPVFDALIYIPFQVSGTLSGTFTYIALWKTLYAPTPPWNFHAKKKDKKKDLITKHHMFYKPPARFIFIIFSLCPLSILSPIPRFWAVSISISLVKLRPPQHLQPIHFCQCVSILTRESIDTGVFQKWKIPPNS